MGCCEEMMIPPLSHLIGKTCKRQRGQVSRHNISSFRWQSDLLVHPSSGREISFDCYVV